MEKQVRLNRIDLMKNKFLECFVATLITTVVSTQAFAEDVFVSKAWEGHKNSDLCFAVSFPVKEREGVQTHATVTNQFKRGIQDELALVSGFGKTADIKGTLRVDDKKPVKLLVHEGVGYVSSLKVESQVVADMRAGKELKVIWTDENGNTATDQYSLLGFTKSNNFAKKC
jgi:hypothetical protein